MMMVPRADFVFEFGGGEGFGGVIGKMEAPLSGLIGLVQRWVSRMAQAVMEKSGRSVCGREEPKWKQRVECDLVEEEKEKWK
ncbi:hypothetical protein M5689_020756 [Euphorbia peplus]|nr:hypothetical protein M5689_020756 [Euphorbia peplus]